MRCPQITPDMMFGTQPAPQPGLFPQQRRDMCAAAEIIVSALFAIAPPPHSPLTRLFFFFYGSGIAEQVAKPKERATVVASPLDLMPADAPKLQNRLKALADEAERLAAGKKQKMNAETAAEEGGFGFGFDVHASGMNGSGSWIGSGAPAAAVAPHNSRAIRRRREED